MPAVSIPGSRQRFSGVRRLAETRDGRRGSASKSEPMSENPPLSCLKCPSLCCRMAGYVQVSRRDIRRLAKYLGLTVREFEARHIVRKTRKGEKLIKEDGETCQFLAADRTCTVYKARPRDCRGYVCWDQDDSTVYDFAALVQLPVARLRKLESKR